MSGLEVKLALLVAQARSSSGMLDNSQQTAVHRPALLQIRHPGIRQPGSAPDSAAVRHAGVLYTVESCQQEACWLYAGAVGPALGSRLALCAGAPRHTLVISLACLHAWAAPLKPQLLPCQTCLAGRKRKLMLRVSFLHLHSHPPAPTWLSLQVLGSRLYLRPLQHNLDALRRRYPQLAAQADRALEAAIRRDCPALASNAVPLGRRQPEERQQGRQGRQGEQRPRCVAASAAGAGTGAGAGLPAQLHGGMPLLLCATVSSPPAAVAPLPAQPARGLKGRQAVAAGAAAARRNGLQPPHAAALEQRLAEQL